MRRSRRVDREVIPEAVDGGGPAREDPAGLTVPGIGPIQKETAMMTPRNREGGPRPASAEPITTEMPPALVPTPILSQAPKASRAVSLAVSGLIYGTIATGGLLLARTTAARTIPGGTRPEHLIELDPDPAPPAPAFLPPPPSKGPRPPTELTRPRDWVAPDTSNLVPEVVPTTLPTGDHRLDGLYDKNMKVDDRGDGTRNVADLVDNQRRGGGTATTPTVVDLSESALRVLHQAPVSYPPLARMARIQGSVVLQITVDPMGRPSTVDVRSGPVQLQAEALRCAREWRFEPATQNGQPVSARFHLTIVFRLM
jgi:periplasmic protein TonB